MRLRELIVDPARRQFAAAPEIDALTEKDALQEAHLQDVRAEIVSGTAWLLFDCRGALSIEAGNTAVIVATGVSELTWHADRRPTRWSAWPIMTSVPAIVDGRWSISINTLFGGGLSLTADAAEFWVGSVPGCDEAPPDFVADDDATIRAGLASWESEFVPVHAVFLDPAR
jgi:hypothetical protein